MNVCLTHDPALAGLYRAVNDFAAALDAPIVSFDDGRRDRSSLADTEPCPVTRIRAGTGWLSRDCHVVIRVTLEPRAHRPDFPYCATYPLMA